MTTDVSQHTLYSLQPFVQTGDIVIVVVLILLLLIILLGLQIIHSPHMLVPAISERFLLVGDTFEIILASCNRCWYSPFTGGPHQHVWGVYKKSNRATPTNLKDIPKRNCNKENVQHGIADFHLPNG
jgi:hypothetical protein